MRGDDITGLSRDVQSCLDNSAGLHCCDLGVGDSQTAATMAHHGVELVQRSNDVLQVIEGHAHVGSQLLDVLVLAGQELVERRVQITDGHRALTHDAVHRLEVTLLERLDLGQSSLALFYGTCADHLTDSLDAVLSKEHMLGTAQADALSTQVNCLLCVARVISVGHDQQLTSGVCPAHEAVEVLVAGGGDGSDLLTVDVTSGAVDGDPVALDELVAVDLEGLSLFVDLHVVVVAAAGDTAGTHTTSNNGCVAGHAAADGQDALRHLHTDDVLGRGLQTDQNDLLHLAGLDHLLSLFGGEDDLAAGRTGRSCQALANDLSSLQGSCVELGMQQSIQLLGLHAQDSLLLGDHALVHQVTCDLQSSLSGTLAVTGLQHIQVAVLNGELHILHIAEVVLQTGSDLNELVVDLRHLLVQVADGRRSADTSNDVLALCIDEVLAHQLLSAGGGVTGECNAGAGAVAGVTESHLLDVDSGTPLVGDLVHLTIDVCTGVVPAAEDGLDSLDELILGVLGEGSALVVLIDLLEGADQFLQVVSSQVNVVLDALGFLHLIDLDLEQALRDHHDDVGEHLHEAAVAVVCETGVIGLLGQTLDSLVVQAEVQDGVHHAGHGLTCAGTDGDQQRVLVVAEGLAGDLLEALDVLEDVSGDLVVDLTAVCVILGAGLGGDGEALRHRHTGCSHLSQTSALAAQNVLHGDLVAAKGIVAFAEVVQILFAHACLPPK